MGKKCDKCRKIGNYTEKLDIDELLISDPSRNTDIWINISLVLCKQCAKEFYGKFEKDENH